MTFVDLRFQLSNSFRHSRRDMLQRQFASYEMRKKVLLLKIQLVSPVDGEAGTKASIFDALANCPRYNREITMQYSLGVHQLAYCPQHVSCSYTSQGLLLPAKCATFNMFMFPPFNHEQGPEILQQNQCRHFDKPGWQQSATQAVTSRMLEAFPALSQQLYIIRLSPPNQCRKIKKTKLQQCELLLLCSRNSNNFQSIKLIPFKPVYQKVLTNSENEVVFSSTLFCLLLTLTHHFYYLNQDAVYNHIFSSRLVFCCAARTS